MCGICGAIWTKSENEVDQETLDRATDALRRRGPDDRGVFRRPLLPGVPLREKGVAFGHRRLAIVDLSAAGRQPFSNADGTIWLTFNGEIYNYVELREELKRRGRVFRTETDVEVLLQAYEEYGLDCLAKFDGMFAFAIWDEPRRRVLLARDRVGKKPLVYRLERDRLLFASELKSLKAFPNVPQEIDLVALRLYLTYQYVPFPRTIYKGVSKLPPASYMLWREGDAPTVDRYWRAEDLANFDDEVGLSESDLDALRETQALDAAALAPSGSSNLTRATFEEVRRELRRRLEDATRVRMRCDVPFGAFLSGGIDSTIVAGLTRQFSSSKIRTFSIGFAQKEYDETPFARRTAARFGTRHEEFVVKPDAKKILPELVRQYDEPFADSSAIPTWYLCQMTRREVTVALGGDGGDELFCGYDRYKALRLSLALDKLPRGLKKLLAGPVRALVPNSVRQRSPIRRARRFLETAGMETIEQYLQWIAIFNRSRLSSLLSDGYWEAVRADDPAFSGVAPAPDELDVLDFLQDAYGKFAKRDLTTAISFTDALTYLPGDVLAKVDVASMSFALEARSPLLDPNVVELALQIPLRYKLRGRVGKLILREAFRDLLPDEIDARPKTGFGVPIDSWFRNELNATLKEVLFDESSRRESFFNRAYVERLVKEHEERRFDHAARLWALFVFQIWRSQQEESV